MNPQLQWFNPGRRSWGISIANWSLPKTREWKNNNNYAPLADKCNGSERGSCTEKRGMEKKDSKWKMSHLTSSDRGSAEWEWDRTKKKMQEWAIKNKGTGVTIHLYVHSFMCICTYVSGQLSWVAFINQKKSKAQNSLISLPVEVFLWKEFSLLHCPDFSLPLLTTDLIVQVLVYSVHKIK